MDLTRLNKKWNGQPLRSNAVKELWGGWIGGVLFTAGSIGMWLALEKMEQDDESIPPWVWYLNYVFIAATIALWWSTLLKTVRWIRIGATPLTLDPFPGSIGGQVGGRIQYSGTTTELKLALNLSHYYYTRNSKGERSRKIDNVWQQEQFPKAQNGELQFVFDVPDNLRPSEKPSGEYYQWDLHLHGSQVNRTWTLPVMRSQTGPVQSSIIVSAIDQSLAATEQLNQDVKITETGDQLTLLSPAFKWSWGYPIAWGAGYGLLLGAQAFYREGDLWGWLFAAVFALVGSLTLLISVYLFGQAIHCVVSAGRLKTWQTLFGIPFPATELTKDEVQRLKVEESSTTSSGSRVTKTFALAVVRTGRKLSINIAKGIKHQGAAEQLLALVQRFLKAH